VLPAPTGHPGHPDVSRAGRYLLWLAKRQRTTLVVSALIGIVRQVATAAIPLVLGIALDAGLTDGLAAATWWGAAAVLLVGVVAALSSAYGHLYEIYSWVQGSLPTSRVVGHHVTRVGSNITAEAPTGEIVSTITNDTFHLGNFFEQWQRLVGSVAGVLFVGIVLLRSSLTLGLLVLVGMPVVLALVALLIKPLQKRQWTQREAQGKLGALATDTVAGLRVLRGIGGEDTFSGRYAERSQAVRRAGVAVATIAGIMRGAQVLLPGMFVAFVVWYGARMAVGGQMTPGDLVTLFGFMTYLAAPLQSITQFIQLAVRARVGAKKVVTVLGTTPSAGTLAESEEADARPVPPPATSGVALEDPVSGLVVDAGTFVAVVADPPTDADALAARLGRLADAPGTDRTPDDAPALVDGRPVRSMPVADVREQVVVAGSSPELFAGTLREALDVRRRGDDDSILAALRAADGQDVLDSVGGSLDGEVQEKGRSLSGGQRQRVALARVLLTEAPALVMVEPTSAVDAHTEARIARDLADRRAGRTTVVTTSSPLVLEHAGTVAFLKDGRVLANAPHAELVARARAGDPAALQYRAVVTRTTAVDDDAATHPNENRPTEGETR
jgi:ABC-type multidrug transport system fused ATPase/permease subunit